MQWAGKVVNEQMQLKSHERGDPTLNLNLSHIIYRIENIRELSRRSTATKGHDTQTHPTSTMSFSRNSETHFQGTAAALPCRECSRQGSGSAALHVILSQ